MLGLYGKISAFGFFSHRPIAPSSLGLYRNLTQILSRTDLTLAVNYIISPVIIQFVYYIISIRCEFFCEWTQVLYTSGVVSMTRRIHT